MLDAVCLAEAETHRHVPIGGVPGGSWGAHETPKGCSRAGQHEMAQTKDEDAQLLLPLLRSAELQPMVENILLSQAGSDVLPALH